MACAVCWRDASLNSLSSAIRGTALLYLSTVFDSWGDTANADVPDVYTDLFIYFIYLQISCASVPSERLTHKLAVDTF